MRLSSKWEARWLGASWKIYKYNNNLPSFPSLPSLSFIQFNFELCTGRQAKRVAPWLPGTRPSHYTANWFWPAATSAAYLPHTPHPTLSTISAPQTVCSRGDFRTHRKERGKQLNFAYIKLSLHPCATAHIRVPTNRSNHHSHECMRQLFQKLKYALDLSTLMTLTFQTVDSKCSYIKNCIKRWAKRSMQNISTIISTLSVTYLSNSWVWRIKKESF